MILIHVLSCFICVNLKQNLNQYTDFKVYFPCLCNFIELNLLECSAWTGERIVLPISELTCALDGHILEHYRRGSRYRFGTRKSLVYVIVIRSGFWAVDSLNQLVKAACIGREIQECVFYMGKGLCGLYDCIIFY